MHAGGVGLPLGVHVVSVVCVGAIQEVVFGSKASLGGSKNIGCTVVKGTGSESLSGAGSEQMSLLRKHMIM